MTCRCEYELLYDKKVIYDFTAQICVYLKWLITDQLYS